MDEHNAFRRAAQLHHIDTPDLVESLDMIIGQAGDLGEKRCQKRLPEWCSLELVRQRLTVSYLGHYLKGLKCGRDRSEVIITRLQAIHFPIDSLSLSIKTTQELIVHHAAKLKLLSDSSSESQTKYLASLDSSQSNKINKHEIALSTWRTVAYLKGTTTASTLTQLDIPSNWPTFDKDNDTV